MSGMKEVQGNLEVYSSPRRGEIYVDYKGERIISIPDVPARICRDDDKSYNFVMDNYSDVIMDCVNAMEAD